MSKAAFQDLKSHILFYKTQRLKKGKARKKSSHTDRYEHGERSMLVFISTVVNTSNGRCETTFCGLSPN